MWCSARPGGLFRKASTGSELPSTASSGVLALADDEDFEIALGDRETRAPQEGLAPGTPGVDSEPPQGRNGGSSPVHGLLEIVTGQRDRFRQRYGLPPCRRFEPARVLYTALHALFLDYVMLLDFFLESISLTSLNLTLAQTKEGTQNGPREEVTRQT